MSSKLKSKSSKIPTGAGDQPETIVEEQENESSAPETTVSRLSRIHRKERTTTTNMSLMRLENTYKLKPDTQFLVGRVNEKINQVLSARLTDFEYTPEEGPNVTMELSASVKTAVKQLKMNRHKLVVLVTMFPVGDNYRPSVIYSSRCLWNTETDKSTSVVYNSKTATVVVLVFGLYYD